VVAVHATGFCKETWWPVAASLPDRVVLAFDQRGHGDSTAPAPPFDWWDLGRDVLAVLDVCAPAPTIGLGHSSGATALLMAELLRPGSFRVLALVEPIVFPGPPFRAEENPMSATALRRRATFATPDAALESFRGRGPFARWTEPALRAYVEGGLRPAADGWALKCDPATEAEFYRSATEHGVWDRLGDVASPVVLVAGEASESHPGPFIRHQAACLREARVEVVPEATHFVPMERPDAVAALVDALAAEGVEPATR
jgi:pimeloyl-ACP methyl ester carboxylesterase